ncbi:MAG: NAD(P)-dependent oxidoreductase [Chloroflexi bacterium]|nr:MAG: NAD(P)-dependent oxidoreductase [Chloroflexota bacterium]
MRTGEHVLVTGGAGYIGSLLTAELLRSGYLVTVVDNLLYGGDSLLGFIAHPDLHFVKADICEPGAIRLALRHDWPRPTAVIHQAALAGFLACQAVGKEVACRYNIEGAQRVFDQANQLGIDRFLFASTYSVYANDPAGKPVKETSPLEAHSLYSETKVSAEEWLRSQGADASTALLIFRQATAYGLSPRIRFDLLVNQFVLDAFIQRELIIYQGGFARSFVHIQDAVSGYLLALSASIEKVRNQVYNLGSESGNYTKDGIVKLVLQRFPEVVVRYRDLSFGGDMRDLTVSFEKIHQVLGFDPQKTAHDGVEEVAHALRTGLIRNPYDRRYRNADILVH